MLRHPFFCFDARLSLASFVLFAGLALARDARAQSPDGSPDARASDAQVPAETADRLSTPAPGASVAAPTIPPAAPTLLALPPATAESTVADVDAQYARAHRHAKRLEIAGWTIFATGLAALVIGAPIASAQERKATAACRAEDPTDSWCDFLQGLAPIAVATFAVPVALVGAIVGGRGTALRRRLPPPSSLSLAPTVSRTAFGLTLRGRF